MGVVDRCGCAPGESCFMCEMTTPPSEKKTIRYVSIENAIPVEVIGGHQKRDGLWWAKLRADEPVMPDSYYLVKRNPKAAHADD